MVKDKDFVKISHAKKMLALPVVVFLAITILVCGIGFTYMLSRYAEEEVKDESISKLDSVLLYIEERISAMERDAKILARAEHISQFLKKGENKDAVDKNLQNIKDAIKASVVYIMDRNGTVQASSNSREPDSFLGKNYAFRPYFQEAMRGMEARYFAKGKTSSKKGLYVSHPIITSRGRIEGVAVIKVNLDNIENLLRTYDNCFMVDKDKGIVFIDHKDLPALRTLWPVDQSRQAQAAAVQQYGDIDYEPLLDEKIPLYSTVVFEGRKMMFAEKYISGTNMMLVKFSDPSRIQIYTLTGAAVTLFGVLFSLSFLYILILIYRSRERIQREKDTTDQMFQLTPSGVFTVDADRNILSWNKKCEEITGFTQEEVIGKNCAIFSDFPCGKKCGVYSTDVKKPIKGVECTIKTKSGSTRIIRKNADLLLDKNGELIGAIESFEDFTEAVASETKIRQLLQAVEQSRSVIVITDTEGNITYVNPSFCKLTGYSSEEAIGQNPRILKTDYLDKEHYKELWDTITSGHTWHGEFHNKKKSGELFWERAIISPVKDAAGRIINFIAVKEDVTKAKANEEALLLSEERLNLAFNAINEGIWDYEPQSDKLYLSPTWFSMLDYSPDDLPSTYETWTSLIHPDDVEKAENAFRDFMSKNMEVFDIEFRMKTKTGKWRWINSRAKTFERDSKGLIKRMVGTHSDITKRKNAELEREKALQVKSKFTSMVSHELRTPLTAIKGGVDLILEGFVGDINNEQQDLLQRVQGNVDRLHRLINDILDFQKLDSGMMSFDMSSCDIKEIVTDVYESMKLVAEEKDLKLRIDVEKDLPEIRIDRDRVIQVLMNLINNSIKFTETGEIGVKVLRDGNMIHVSVWDTGPGIKEEDKKKLFKSFQQLDTTKDKKRSGTGLGLAISKEIVEKHRGKIWVESVFGRGSAFHFSLPIFERRRGHGKEDIDSR